ncbi:hypothetical protein [Streptomyces sp. NPDC051994]
MRPRRTAAARTASAAARARRPVANSAPHHGRTYYVDCSTTEGN